MTFIEKLPNWLRWGLTPFSSIVTLIIVSLVIGLIARLFGFKEGDFFDDLYRHTLHPAVTGYAALYGGVVMAPSNKKIVALCQGGLLVLFGGFAVTGALSIANWWGLINIISTVIGVGAGIYQVFTEETN